MYSETCDHSDCLKGELHGDRRGLHAESMVNQWLSGTLAGILVAAGFETGNEEWNSVGMVWLWVKFLKHGKNCLEGRGFISVGKGFTS